MRRRLTVFIVGIVAVILVLAGVGTWYLAQQSVRRSAQTDALSTVQALAKNDTALLRLLAGDNARLRPATRTAVRKFVDHVVVGVGHLDGAYFFRDVAGTFKGSLPPADLHIDAGHDRAALRVARPHHGVGHQRLGGVGAPRRSAATDTVVLVTRARRRCVVVRGLPHPGRRTAPQRGRSSRSS